MENVTIRTKGLLTTCPSLFPVPAKFGFADILPLSVKSFSLMQNFAFSYSVDMKEREKLLVPPMQAF